MGLQKKKVVIIGGSAGIGKATARRALEAGARVVIASRNEKRLRTAEEELGGMVQSAVIDVRDTRGMEHTLDGLAPFHHLVFTAAENVLTPFLEVDLQDAKVAFDVKFWGQFAAVQQAAADITEGGSITLVSGTSAHKPIEGMSIIAAINGATEALTRSLAVELSPLRVNAVCPGFVDTKGIDPARREELAGRLPARVAGEAGHIAHAILYLIENTYATGTVLHVDGGNCLV